MAESNPNTPTTSDNMLCLVKDRYKIIKVLGRGSYGEVWLVSPLESCPGYKSKPRRCVLKRVSVERSTNDKNELAAAEREAQLLSSLSHPNIVAYIESFRSRDYHLNIVMAFCEGGDLYTKLKYRKKELLSEEQIVEWFIQITLALHYMHGRHILHRDLKTQNIFLTKNELVKVGDLGIAKILDKNGGDMATTVIGTPYYMSPEIFSNQPYDHKSDIWALGCCVYEMATLEHAFKAGDISSLVLKIVRGQTPTLSSAEKYSAPLVELIYAMLDKDATNRPTTKQILQNPYIKQHILRFYDKTRQRCQSYATTPSAQPSLVNTSVDEASRLSVPPAPKPRSIISSTTDEDISEKEPSSKASLSQSRARRLQQKNVQSNNEVPSSSTPAVNSASEDEEKDTGAVNQSFIQKIRQNDTLARFKRNVSSPSPTNQSDETNNARASLSARQRRREQRSYPTTNSSENNKKHPVTPPKDGTRNPTTPPVDYKKTPESPSDGNKKHSTTGAEDSKMHVETPPEERKSYPTTPLEVKNELPSSSPAYDRSISVDGQNDAVEQERKAKKDMDDLLNQLDATLRLPPSSTAMSVSVEVPSMVDRTMMETSKLKERRDALRENCLKEIPPEKLKRVLDIVDLVTDRDIKAEMIAILGDDIYNRYSGYIYSLKYYENSIFIRQ